MSPLTVAKLALAGGGVLVFGYGIRVDSPGIRWVGIAMLGCAFLLRFIGPPKQR
jgi:hypothetical protein